MANEQQMYRYKRFKQIWLIVIGIPIFFLTLFPNAAWAESTGPGGENDSSVFSALQAGKRLEGNNHYTDAPARPTVYLTFDDGPSKLTPEILDILRDHGIKAAFFALGNQVEAYPGTARRIVEEGHTIGNHSYNHVYKELYSDFNVFWSQVEKTERIITETTGVRPRLIRAPGGTFGNFDAFYFYYLDQAGYVVHDWNMDSEDSRPGRTVEDILRTVEHSTFRNEVVLLMHDGTGHGETVKALPRVIELFKEKGYEFAQLTPEVKPVHFSSGKIKWARTVGKAAFEEQRAAAEAHKKVWLEDSESANKEAAEEKPRAASLPEGMILRDAGKEQAGWENLTIGLNEKELQLEKGGFDFHGGHFIIPLRQVIEAMGGIVEWDADRRTATVRYGLSKVDYDMAKRELRVSNPLLRFTAFKEVQRVYSFPEMELKEGTLYVPLSKMMELLNLEITAYHLDPEKGRAKVFAGVHNKFGLVLGLFPLLRNA